MGEVGKLEKEVHQLKEREGDYLHLLSKQEKTNADLISSKDPARDRLAKRGERYLSSLNKQEESPRHLKRMHKSDAAAATLKRDDNPPFQC